MKDRVPTQVLENGAIRYAEYDSSGNFVQYRYMLAADEPSEEGTALSKANLLQDVTAALYKLGSDAVPDDVFVAANERINKNTINNLVSMLKAALSNPSSGIDAWADIFDGLGGATQISGGYTPGAGSLAIPTISNLTDNGTYPLGETSSGQKVAQSFSCPGDFKSLKVTAKLKKVGSPTDNLICKIYTKSGSVPGTVLHSSESIAGSSLATTLADITFTFLSVDLSNSSDYCIVFERDGTVSDTNCYEIQVTTNTYSGGAFSQYSGSGWTGYSDTDLYFIITADNATLQWIVTPKEAFAYAAVCADQDKGTGAIAWYMSDKPNLIANGGFENGLIGWDNLGTWHSISSTQAKYGTYSMKQTCDGSNQQFPMQEITDESLNGHVIYVSAWCYIESSGGSAFTLKCSSQDSVDGEGDGTGWLTFTTVGDWGRQSGRFTCNRDGISFLLAQTNASGTGVAYYDGALALDLTVLYGAGNEPTKEWCDSNISYDTLWTEITALDTMQAVNFDAAGMALKCVLNGDAEVDAVAWGGY